MFSRKTLFAFFVSMLDLSQDLFSVRQVHTNRIVIEMVHLESYSDVYYGNLRNVVDNYHSYL